LTKLFDTCPECDGSGVESQAGNLDVVCCRCGGHGEIVLGQPGPQASEEDHAKFADRVFAAIFGSLDEEDKQVWIENH